jgi:hypothetical protein
MKKLSILLVTGIISCWIPAVSAQSQKVITENFDGNITGTASPASAWKIDTNYYVSPHNSIRGVVPNKVGDETELVSPVYDFSNYDYVYLHFNHICKISPLDIARVEYRVDMGGGMGAWELIPGNAYMGKSVYSRINCFNANSYTEWIANDSICLPAQSWWKEEVFDIGPEVGMESKVQFRFVLKHGDIPGTQISYGWLIDSIKIIAATYEIGKPVVEFIPNCPLEPNCLITSMCSNGHH